MAQIFGKLSPSCITTCMKYDKQKYREYLESPEWKEKRTAVMERCNYWCEDCRRERAVHVHHLTYERIYNEDLEDLIGVCKSCHEDRHGIGGVEYWERQLQMFLKYG